MPGKYPTARTRRFTACPEIRAAGTTMLNAPCAFVGTEITSSEMKTLANSSAWPDSLNTFPEMTAFCASKYAVTGLTDTLRLELAPKGIQVCAVHPGLVNSNFLEQAIFRGQDAAQVEERRKQIQAMVQAPWVSQPEDIADAIWSAVREGKSEVIVGQPMTATEALQVAA